MLIPLATGRGDRGRGRGRGRGLGSFSHNTARVVRAPQVPLNAIELSIVAGSVGCESGDGPNADSSCDGPRSGGGNGSECNNGSAPPLSYAGAVKAGNQLPGNCSDSAMHFSDFAPLVEEGRVRVAPPSGVATEGMQVWEKTLVGYFVGPKPSYSAVNATAHRLWDGLGLVEGITEENGFFD